MYEIIPNLYLSAYHEVKTTQNTFIVNCTKNLPMKCDGIRIAVDDDMSREAMYGMLQAFENTIEMIHQQLANNKEVVVHCLAGQQRSPTVIAAYLITKCNFTLEDAIIHIRNKKKDAFFWMVNFRDSLEQYNMILKSKK